MDKENPETPEDTLTGLSGRDIKWALEYCPWAEWLGMEVDIPTSSDLFDTEAKILANIFYEMTFCGYSQKDIDDELTHIKSIIDEIEEDIKQKEDNKEVDDVFSNILKIAKDLTEGIDERNDIK